MTSSRCILGARSIGAFQTKPQIARDLLTQVAPRFPAKWIGCDATFGADWAFLDALPPGLSYFASIKANTQVFLTKPRVGGGPPIAAVAVGPANRVSGRARRCRSARAPARIAVAGPAWCWATGPIRAEVAGLRVYPCVAGLPRESPVWVFLRRTDDGQVTYAFSNAPHNTTLAELCEAANLRWPIEQCFQDGKRQVGMNHYEHRSWPGRHRHMLYVRLALHFLLRLRLRFKNPGADAPTSADPGGRHPPMQETHAHLCLGTCDIPHKEES